MNLESSGNFLWAADRLLGNKRVGETGDLYNKILDVRYAQFVKADAEFRHNWYINRINSDIRAWQARTLGPGSYSSDDYPNSVGDFKLAANLEYRFKLIWLLEGALFVDAGNVWNINHTEDREGTRLTMDFYNQIAIGTGAGLRLNANFFLLRFDFGIKLKDPSLPAGDRFVLFNSHGGFRRSVFNIAIGYPF